MAVRAVAAEALWDAEAVKPGARQGGEVFATALRPVLRKHLGSLLGEQLPEVMAAILSDFGERASELDLDEPTTEETRLSLVEPEQTREQAAAGKLLPHHHDMLRLVAEGYTNREIAKKLYWAYSTVKFSMSRILTVLEADTRTRTEAVKIGYEKGFLETSATSIELFAAPPALTDRELEFLILQSEGETDSTIASLKNLSYSAVKYINGPAARKLGARTRAQAVSRGIDLGLVPAGRQLKLPV